MLAGWPELKGKEPATNICSKFWLCHLYRYMRIKGAYKLEDIPPNNIDARDLVDTAEKYWHDYEGSKNRLARGIISQYWSYVIGIGLMCLGKGVGSILLSVLMKMIISEIGNGITTKILLLCAAITIVDFIVVSFDRMYVGFSMFLSMRVRVSVTGLIYRKLMKTKISALQFTSDGQLSNFVGADVERLFLCIMPIQYVWVSPAILILVVLIMWYYCGALALSGYAMVAFLSIIQIAPTQLMGYFRLKSAILGDRRLSLTNEAIEAVHLIKACVWESAISKSIDIARWAEVKAKIWQSICEAIKDVFSNVNRLWVLVFVTLLFVILGEEVSAGTVFPMSSLYQTSCTWFPGNFIWGLQDLIYARVSVNRVQEFLELSDAEANEEVDLFREITSISNPLYPDDKPKPPPARGVEEVLVRDSTGNLADLSPKSQKLIGLAGGAATGKTTFIYDLLGFRLGGTVKKLSTADGRIGYAPQDSWIFPGTLRENILAGLPFQSQRYWDVIRACCLDEDLRNLKYGDQTRIGFGGITLSGGQQARVTLARAVYSNCDLYVFDDPFSAINQKIAKRIFKLCCQQFLDGKTRIVTLHDDSFLSACDHVLIFPMTGGPGEEMASKQEHPFQDFAARKMSKILSESESETADILTEIERRRTHGDAFTFGVTSASEAEGADGTSRAGRRRYAISEMSKQVPEGESPLYHQFGEELSESVNWRVYFKWCQAAGVLVTTYLFLNFAAARSMVALTDLWLTSWTAADCTDSPYTIVYINTTTGECDEYQMNWYYWKFYFSLVLIAFLLAVPLSTGWRVAFMLAADRLHRRMIRCTLRAPMSYIFEKSYGEISNRFSRDVNGVDWVVIFMSYSFLDGVTSILAYVVVICMENWYIIFGAIPAFLAILVIRRFYLKCTAQLARLEAEAKSPYFTHFQTSFNGLPIVRSLRLEANMVTDFHKFQNVFIAVVTVFLDLLLWLDLMVGMVGVFFMAVVSYGCVIIANATDSASSMGLVLMYCMSLLETLQKNIRESAELDNKMVHTERILEFTHLPREEPDRGDAQNPKQDDEAFTNVRPFPVRHGQISAQDVSLRYSPDSPWVLKNFYLDIQGGEKIGLAGRTGCGKSSFLNVLLRMYPFDGTLYVDGTDIKQLTLASLRRGISIMTQFPVLFSMTIRQNLDPNMATRDDELWRALEMVGMKEAVLRLPLGMETEIRPDTLEWSAGQKQLFCFARTLLEGRKIVLMDEPTSQLDTATAKLLWDKCIELLKDCTVIIVSHMPSQLTFCNRIINMDAKADAAL